MQISFDSIFFYLFRPCFLSNNRLNLRYLVHTESYSSIVKNETTGTKHARTTRALKNEYERFSEKIRRQPKLLKPLNDFERYAQNWTLALAILVMPYRSGKVDDTKKKVR